MKKTKKFPFHLYRFQLVPISQDLQLDLFDDIKSIEDLKKQKNVFFDNVLDISQQLTDTRTEIKTRKIIKLDDYHVFKLGANRSLRRITKEFVEEEIDNWPLSYIFVNNNPEIQIIAIQHNRKVFQKTSTIMKIIENNLNERLNRYQLSILIEEIFEKKKFWNIVHKNRNKI